MKTLAITILLASLFSLVPLNCPLDIPEALAYEEFKVIYIKNDGLIVPSTAPLAHEGNLYNLYDDIYGCLIIERDNIIVDGRNFTLLGNLTFESKGVALMGRLNVTIRNLKIAKFYFGIWLRNSHNCEIFQNMMTENTGRSVWLGNSSHNYITENNITRNHGRGIMLDNSHNNIIESNKIINGSCDAIVISHSNNTIIFKNTIAGNTNSGIWLGYSTNNTIFENTIAFNMYDGLGLYYSQNNKIFGNAVVDNNYHGISLKFSSFNDIYNNNFINNGIQVYIESSPNNTWNVYYPFGGNYWSNYDETDLCCGPFQNITGSDGIGDKPYSFDKQNVDNYPLMGVYSIFHISINSTVSVISNSTVEYFSYFPSENMIRLNVSSIGTDETSGFCRLAIPKEVLASYNVTVNGFPVQYTILFEDATIGIVYFNYFGSNAHIVIIPEFELNIELILLIVLVAWVTLVLFSNLKRSKVCFLE